MDTRYCLVIIQCLLTKFVVQFSESLFPTFSSFLKFHNLPILPSSQHLVTIRILKSREIHLFFLPANLQTHLHPPTTFPLATTRVSAPKGPLLRSGSQYLLTFLRTSFDLSYNYHSGTLFWNKQSCFQFWVTAQFSRLNIYLWFLLFCKELGTVTVSIFSLSISFIFLFLFSSKCKIYATYLIYKAYCIIEHP